MTNLHHLIAKGESQTTEFKTSFQKEVIATVVAFANAKGGKIFIGVKDDGSIVGVTQSFNDISLEKVDRFIKRIEKNFEKNFDDNPMQVLQKYGLVRDDKITFGAYLLFVKEFCLISGVQAGRFKTSTDIIDSISLNSDILNEIDELLIFVRKHLMVEYIITGNAQREERYDYPLDAIREVILNMIVHRDYRDSSDSVIKIFDDRIEFFNPGDLYDDLTVEKLLSNNYESKTRNKLIALMFKECGLIEKYGSGISRIKKLCKEHNIVEPKFEEMQKGFKVTLYKKKLSTTQETTQETKLSTKEKIILELKKDNSLTREVLAQKIGVSANAIKQHLSKLKSDGILKRVGSTNSGYWEVLDGK